MERAQSSPRRAGTEQSGISSDDDPLAQSAEQLPFKQWVRGSNPRRVKWLGWLDSNQRMRESKSRALPLGDTPMF